MVKIYTSKNRSFWPISWREAWKQIDGVVCDAFGHDMATSLSIILTSSWLYWTSKEVNPLVHFCWIKAGFLASCEAHFLWKKDKECACKFTFSLNARRTFIEKTHGNWKGFRDARFSWKKKRNPEEVGRVSIWIYNHIERKTHFTWEKHRETWGVGTALFIGKTHESAGVGHAWHINLQSRMKARRILHEKTQWFLRGRREWHVNLLSKWRPHLFYMRKHNDFSAVGGELRRGRILIRNRDWWRSFALAHTTLYYKVLLQFYSSTTLYYKVLLRTTEYYSSTTYSVLQSTTPYYYALLQYYSLLQSTTLYYKVLSRTTKY